MTAEVVPAETASCQRPATDLSAKDLSAKDLQASRAQVMVLVCTCFVTGVALVVTAASFGGGTALGCAAGPGLAAILAGLILLLVRGLSGNGRKTFRGALSGLGAFSCGVVVAFCRFPAPAPDDISTFSGKRVTIEARVLEVRNPERRSAGSSDDAAYPAVNGQVLYVECLKVNNTDSVSGLLRLNLVGGTGSEAIAIGDTVETRVMISATGPPAPEWMPDYSFQQRRKNVFACAFASIRNLRIEHPSGSHDPPRKDAAAVAGNIAAGFREKVVAFHRSALGEVRGDLLSSMVFGDRAVSPDRELVDQFRATGLSHILAASGFNLTIVIAFVTFIARLFSGSNRVSSITGLMGIAVYVSLSGVSPSITRAILMCSLVLVLHFFYRREYMPAVIAFSAALTLLVDPFACADIGMQLSYAATLAMVTGVQPLVALLRRMVPFAHPAVLDLIAATLLAQAAVLPLQLWHFKDLGMWFVVANLLVLPLVPIVSVLGFTSSLIVIVSGGSHYIEWLPYLVDRVLEIPLLYITEVVQVLSNWPLARLDAGAAGLSQVVAFYLAFCFFLTCLRVRRLELVSFSCLAVFLFLLVYRLPLESDKLIKVRGGEILVRRDRTVITFGNPNPARLRRVLNAYGGKLDPSCQLK